MRLCLTTLLLIVIQSTGERQGSWCGTRYQHISLCLSLIMAKNLKAKKNRWCGCKRNVASFVVAFEVLAFRWRRKKSFSGCFALLPSCSEKFTRNFSRRNLYCQYVNKRLITQLLFLHEKSFALAISKLHQITLARRNANFEWKALSPYLESTNTHDSIARGAVEEGRERKKKQRRN